MQRIQIKKHWWIKPEIKIRFRQVQIPVFGINQCVVADYYQIYMYRNSKIRMVSTPVFPKENAN